MFLFLQLLEKKFASPCSSQAKGVSSNEEKPIHATPAKEFRRIVENSATTNKKGYGRVAR
jgi:hypothetical protein